VCREAIPRDRLRVFEREYPFAWLGILAEAPPSSEELIYTRHERGFALASLRSPELARLYIQCRPDETLDDWPDEKIWEEMRTRFATEDERWTLNEGPVLDRLIAPMRSFVAEPMQHGRLFLAGDAAHIVPPTGAKGLNLAIADVRVLAEALAGFYRSGDRAGLAAYSDTCVRRVWRAQHFSWWMTSMLHVADDDAFGAQLMRSQLEYVVRSEAAATTLAENYVGLTNIPVGAYSSR
jgi:p-hydroxybenzoate 3-monooxygenase